MAKHQLQFYGTFDGSQIEQQAKKLSQTIESTFGQDGVPIVDKDSMRFLESASSDAVNAIRNELSEMKEEASKYEKEIQKANKGSEEQNRLVAKRLEMVKKVADKEAQLGDIQKKQFRIQQSQGSLPFSKSKATDTEGNVIQFPKARQGGNVQNRQSQSQQGSFLTTLSDSLKGIGAGITDSISRVVGALPVPNVTGAASGAINAGSRFMRRPQGNQAPGASSAASGAVGMAAGAALTTLAGAAGTAVIAIQRMASAASVYSEQIPKFLRLSAFGQDRAGGVARETAIQMGYTAQETFDVQEQLTKALGQTSQGGSEARVANVMTASRQLGMDPGQMAGMADRLRAAGGTEVAGKQMADLLNKAVTKGMDASQASHFLEASTSMLATLNESGIMSTDRMLAAMAELTLDAGISAEQSAKILTSMQAAVTGSQGEANAFFQMGAARGELGGGSMLGAQEAVRQGLTGLNMEELTRGMDKDMAGKTRAAFGGLSGENYTQNFAGGILEQLDAISPDTGSSESFLQRSRVTADMFGAGTAAEGAKILAVLKKLEEGGMMSDEDKALLEGLEKDPEKEWRGQVKSALDEVAANTATLKAGKSFIQTDLGEKSQSLFNNLTAALNKLDAALLGFLNSDTFTGMLDMMSRIGTGIMESIGKVKEGFQTLMDDPAQFGMDLATGFLDAVKTGFEAIWEGLKAVFEDIKQGFLNDLNPFSDDNDGERESVTGKVLGGASDALGGAVAGAMNWFSGTSAAPNPLLEKQKSGFESASGGKELEDKSMDEFLQMRKQFKQTGKVDKETLSDFNKDQGVTGDKLDMSEMLEVLKNIAQNTGKTANGKRRVELQGNPVTSTSPNLK